MKRLMAVALMIVATGCSEPIKYDRLTFVEVWGERMRFECRGTYSCSTGEEGQAAINKCVAVKNAWVGSVIDKIKNGDIERLGITWTGYYGGMTRGARADLIEAAHNVGVRYFGAPCHSRNICGGDLLSCNWKYDFAHRKAE